VSAHRTATRRDFLRYSAAAPAIMAAGRAIGANDRIAVGVIGLGGRGSYLLDMVLHRVAGKSDVEVVALCDPYQARLNKAAAKVPGAKTYAHHQELLQHPGLNAVTIATPDHWHAPIALAALDRGLEVYCEKPMTHTLEEARVVRDRVREKNRIMQVGVQALSWERWRKIREVVQAGTLGKVVAVQGTYSRNNQQGDWNWKIDPGAGPDGAGDLRIDWKQWLGNAPERPFDPDRFFRFRKYWDYSGGIATDLHYHIVAPFHLALENEHPARIAGMGGLWIYNDGREVPDTFLTAADYPGKYSLTVQSSQVNEIGPTMMIRGTHATMHLGDEWEGPQGRSVNVARIVPETPFRRDFRTQWGKDEIVLEGVGNEGDQKHMDNFFDCVRTRQKPNCDADMGYKVMTAIDLSVRSYRENKIFLFDPQAERIANR
jgi:predicted dehydrogenase